jgi:hypothetical protein
VTGVEVTFPNLNSPSFGGEDFQTNLIMPEPTAFISRQLPACSIICPTATKGAAMGALASLTADGLFIGQSAAFFGFMRDQRGSCGRSSTRGELKLLFQSFFQRVPYRPLRLTAPALFVQCHVSLRRGAKAGSKSKHVWMPARVRLRDRNGGYATNAPRARPISKEWNGRLTIKRTKSKLHFITKFLA